MKKSQIISIIVGGVLSAAMITATVVTHNLGGIIDDFFDETDFSFESEDFKKASAASDELCQKLAEGGIALLRNENKTLPYDDYRVNVFGWASTDNGFLLSGIGSGSSTIRKEAAVTLLDAFEKEGWETNQELTKFYTDYDNTSFKGKFSTGDSSRITLIEPGPELYTPELIQSCQEFSDQAVIVLSRVCGENVGEIPLNQRRKGYGLDSDRTYLAISQEEEALVKMVTENFGKVTVIINSSNTMELGFLEKYDVGACLNVGLVGQSGALAIPRIIFGDINPSGRAADTFVYDSQFRSPSFSNYQARNNNIGYFEGVYVGYRYYETAAEEGFFDDVDNDYGTGYNGVVQYPFGYGLSYTDFEWKVDSVKDSKGNDIAGRKDLDPAEDITVTFECTNKGNFEGADVMQVYGHAPYYVDSIEKPSTQLLDFCKTAVLPAGQTQRGLTCTFKLYDLASYDCYDANGNGFKGYELEEGNYSISFNKDAHTLMTLADNAPAEVKFSFDEDQLIDVDPETGVEVKNHFTGADAYGGIPLDGSTGLNTAPSYLSRSDFGATLNALHAAGASNNTASSASTYTNTSYDQTEMPVTGVESNLRIVKDGKFDEALIDSIGDNYDSENLTKLVNQMSRDEIKATVELSGFGTPAIESVGKPECFDFDGPAGFNQNTKKLGFDNGKWTAFPAEVLIGQSFDKDLARQMGTAVAAEARVTGLTGWYAPGVNIHRSPYSGRNYEYYSEDPVLSGKMAAGVILAAKNHGLYCYVKHFTMAEEGPNPRNVNTWTTEQAYREIYLRPFEISVKEGETVAIMSGFNNIASIWCGSCYAQNVSILREEWGFRGTMVTDWSGGDGVMNPTRGIRAGNDIWLNPNNTSGSPININDPTNVYCAKMAARNVLWTFINTHCTMMHYDTSLDEVQLDVGVSIANRKTKPWRAWIYIADGVIIGGSVIWIGLSFALPVIKARKKVD